MSGIRHAIDRLFEEVVDAPVDVMPDNSKRTARDAGIDTALSALEMADEWHCQTIRDPSGRDRAVALAIEHAIGVLASVRGAR